IARGDVQAFDEGHILWPHDWVWNISICGIVKQQPHRSVLQQGIQMLRKRSHFDQQHERGNTIAMRNVRIRTVLVEPFQLIGVAGESPARELINHCSRRLSHASRPKLKGSRAICISAHKDRVGSVRVVKGGPEGPAEARVEPLNIERPPDLHSQSVGNAT
ncbi:hypothetical protein C0992_001135, partial [Termitomyces sp. T32_za158]